MGKCRLTVYENSNINSPYVYSKQKSKEANLPWTHHAMLFYNFYFSMHQQPLCHRQKSMLYPRCDETEKFSVKQKLRIGSIYQKAPVCGGNITKIITFAISKELLLPIPYWSKKILRKETNNTANSDWQWFNRSSKLLSTNANLTFQKNRRAQHPEKNSKWL